LDVSEKIPAVHLTPLTLILHKRRSVIPFQQYNYHLARQIFDQPSRKNKVRVVENNPAAFK